jgi:competence protein ComEA
LTEEGTTRTINLAQKLSDGMVIYVPTVEEIESDPNPSALVPPLTGIDDPGNTQGKVKINSATVDQLKTLPGIGPSKAKAIVEYRQAHGLFQQIDDLLNVSGIGTKTLEQIRDLIEL